MKLKLLSILLILTLLPLTGAAQILKELPTKPELDNYTLTLDKGYGFVNESHIKMINDHETWPHDKWISPEGTLYESFYYGNSSALHGYTSVYYDDYGNKLPSKCRLVLKLVEPYYGLNQSNTSQTVENLTQDLCDTVNKTYEVDNETADVKPDTIELKMKNSTSKNEVGLTANISTQESFNEDSFFESIKQLFKSIFGGSSE